jgi:hypothetical protein
LLLTTGKVRQVNHDERCLVRRIATSGLVAIAAVLGAAVLAAASPGAASAATSTRLSPLTAVRMLTAARDSGRAGIFGGVLVPGLQQVSCYSARDCLAIGAKVNASTSNESPIAASWNGTKWTPVAVPLAKPVTSAESAAVSCATATHCLVLVQTLGNPAVLAFSWNGKALVKAVAPGTPSGGYLELSGLSCVSAKYCVAIGMNMAGTSLSAAEVAETWNGKAWSAHQLTKPSATVMLAASVACVSVTDCEVAGTSVAASSGATSVFAGKWTGSKYTAQKVPAILAASKTMPLITGLSCNSATSCLLVGAAVSPSSSATVTPVAAAWNGTAWTASKVSLPKGVSQALPLGVGCPRSVRHGCAVVGVTPTAAGSARALALWWNGKGYTLQKTPSPAAGQLNVLSAVTCQSAKSCVGVGASGSAASGSPKPLGGEWNGTTWKFQAA